MSARRQALLSAYWFAVSAHWTAILVVLLPAQAQQLGGDAFKGRTLGLVLLAGAFVSMVVAPIFGAISDRVRWRLGRRRPFLIIGTLGNMLALLGLAYLARPQALWLYILAFMAVEFFNNVATAPYSALIPDVVPAAQRGAASGWLGLMTMLGNFLGGIMGLLLGSIGGITGAYWLLAAVMLIGMLITVFSVQEPEPPPLPPFAWGLFLRNIFSPFKSRDFTWVFSTRFLMVMGTFVVQEFLVYYLDDVVRAPFTILGLSMSEAAQAVSFVILALLVGAILSSLVAGVISDRFGRKKIVYISGALQGVVVLVFLFTHSYPLAVVMGIVFGLGYGAYISVDWALATDVLPSMDDYARDMGVWHVALTLPQVIGTPVAGFLLDLGQGYGPRVGLPTLGYSLIFSLALLFFIFGTVFVSRIKGAR
jgi:MFS family permease